MSEILLLSRKDVERLLSMKDSLDAVEQAFRQLSLGSVIMPPRTVIKIRKHEGVFNVMPAYIGGSVDALGVKVVTDYPRNPSKNNQPTILSDILVYDPRTGKLLAVMDGVYVTSMRTGAVSGVGTKYLSRKNAKVVGIIGTGVQARTQAMAICEVRNIEKIKCYDIIPQAKQKFSEEMSKKLGVNVLSVDHPKDVVIESDIVVDASTSTTLGFGSDWIRPGTHVMIIGGQEIDKSLHAKSKLIVDSREGFIQHFPQSDPNDIYAELQEIIAGTKKGRISDEEITLFRHVGIAVNDIMPAMKVYKTALSMKAGTTVAL